MSIKRWIRNWLLNENVTLSTRSEVDDRTQEHGAQISIAEAINGRVLTIRTYKPINPQSETTGLVSCTYSKMASR
jgi:hypothetical protein